MSKYKYIAIIPARGGSKGIPHKNIIPLNQKPLIYYSIQAALNCPYIEKCYVSTDSSEIADVAKKFGAEVISRPAHISGDLASSEEVIEHVLSEVTQQHEVEFLALLQPTSPLRTGKHLTECINKYKMSGCLSAVSVCVAEHHPHKMIQIINEEMNIVFGKDNLSKPRQKLPAFYRINGAIYISSVKDFLQNKNFFNEPIFPYVMTQEESVDIDSYFDLSIAKLLLTPTLVSESI